MERCSRPPFQDEAGTWVVTRYDDATAVLADERYVVPEATGGGGRGTLGWLRRTVCRFSEGAAHTRRRALAEAELAGMEPAALRTAARDLAARILDTPIPEAPIPDAPIPEAPILDAPSPDMAAADPVAAVARRVPVAVLGEAMGVRDLDALIAAVPPVAAVYLTGTCRPADADAAVAVLVGLLGPGPDELVANRIAILTQAYEATAALIENAAPVADAGRRPVAAVVAETVRRDPPVRVLRRVASADLVLGGCPVAAGASILVDVRAVNLDPAAAGVATFGAGRRPCPATEQAMALASGVLEALANRRANRRGKDISV